ncbi:flagellar hook capping FlgD N-terminal domain-containing protein [Falsirhodobacter algicola]|uniref:Basal-body rod modification protein FlgD n=1 Tax=Falsirhodobacter algicola TaxID=2692330 RepID=A0A8J8MT24_9RHOB|nr:flagellar hook capping FlgD N-terminal domain-containing protein [Falsirhodobacter algicola]QUS35944.1 flagellar basal body rod modification protein [Falsirhodobacter algicola]
MDVTATTSVTTTTSASGSASSQSDYQTFLKMLTTQLQYQDPTSPMDSSDFAVQLATFSGVEQQTVTNQTLAEISAKLDALGLNDLSPWVGTEVEVDGPVAVNGQPVILRPEIDASADSAVLVVRYAAGATVARQALDVTADEFYWQPVDATGAALTAGTYAVSAESYQGDTLLGTGAVRHSATVAEARNDAQGVTLVLDDGQEVAAQSVTAPRS